ncbi:hypothetical protein ACGFNU_11465 [Spirillospora sp. NPDC048911]|uniref:hypothetical protein n=1 Tax=Spirillospora sp. NPDC048911 TaxID=3364527 RepID=UPI003715BB3E
MKSFSNSLTSKAAKVALIGATVAAGLVAVQTPAQASHKCAHGADEEICFFRLKSYGGGSRAFYNIDATYKNDYWDGTSATNSLDNSITSYVNYDNYWYFKECRYVNHDSCIVVVPPNTYDTNLAGSTWGDGGSLDNSFSSHYKYDLV